MISLPRISCVSFISLIMAGTKGFQRNPPHTRLPLAVTQDAIIKELERTKEELKRSTRTAADAIESRDEMMSRSKVDVERMKRKMLQYEEYSAELERQLRSERLHKSALSHDLQAMATSSSIAEASMSQTIDKQHAKNLDLLHALATVADHKHSHTAKGDAAHARNPILAT